MFSLLNYLQCFFYLYLQIHIRLIGLDAIAEINFD